MALSLIMILHELAANAAKHGARRTGNVKVSWKEVGSDGNELQLTWQEFGVATKIRAEGAGYDATTKSLGARVHRHFLDGGILVDLAIPLR
jgi:two-component sensor histidine kinase